MGTWGIGIFDNDAAADWVFQLEGSSDLSVIDSSLDNALDEDYLDVDYACEALAAVETIARLQGKSGEKTPYAEGVDAWVAKSKFEVAKPMIAKAIKVIDRVLGPESELMELWSESDEFDNWKRVVNELRDRVSA